MTLIAIICIFTLLLLVGGGTLILAAFSWPILVFLAVLVIVDVLVLRKIIKGIVSSLKK